jgi:hypothetical protein
VLLSFVFSKTNSPKKTKRQRDFVEEEARIARIDIRAEAFVLKKKEEERRQWRDSKSLLLSSFFFLLSSFFFLLSSFFFFTRVLLLLSYLSLRAISSVG